MNLIYKIAFNAYIPTKNEVDALAMKLGTTNEKLMVDLN